MSDIYEISQAELVGQKVLYWPEFCGKDPELTALLHEHRAWWDWRDGESGAFASSIYVVTLEDVLLQSGKLKIASPYAWMGENETETVTSDRVAVTRDDLYALAVAEGQRIAGRYEEAVSQLENLNPVTKWASKRFATSATQWEPYAKCDFVRSVIKENGDCSAFILSYAYDNPDTGYSYWREFQTWKDIEALGEDARDVFDAQDDSSLLVSIYDYEQMALWLCDMYANVLHDLDQMPLF